MSNENRLIRCAVAADDAAAEPVKSMRCAFAFNSREIIAAILLSCVIAGCAGAITRANSFAGPHHFTINRTNKGDRLPQVEIPNLVEQAPSATETGTPRVPPGKLRIGCDPAFSPIAAPAMAHISKRCMV